MAAPHIRPTRTTGFPGGGRHVLTHMQIRSFYLADRVSKEGAEPVLTKHGRSRDLRQEIPSGFPDVWSGCSFGADPVRIVKCGSAFK